jgi:hypothetical protein
MTCSGRFSPLPIPLKPEFLGELNGRLMAQPGPTRNAYMRFL